MTDGDESVVDSDEGGPGHGPARARQEADARRALKTHPELRMAGPTFGVAEHTGGRWTIRSLGEPSPQGARDTLSHLFRMYASEAEEAGDQALGEEYMAGARLLEWERHDELTVARRRFRIVRGDQWVRVGPDGPEPPRPSDPDPRPAGDGHRMEKRTHGLAISPVASGAAAILQYDLRDAIPKGDAIPAEVRRDASRAIDAYPRIAVLPAEFAVAEEVAGRWQSLTGSTACPQMARDCLTSYFREFLPRLSRLTEEETAEYARAADRIDRERADEARVCGRRFRISRVEQIIRVGSDGLPEWPRPSDHDPDPPVEVHTRRLREQGLLGPDEDG
jgi:hypothetical protein